MAMFLIGEVSAKGSDIRRNRLFRSPNVSPNANTPLTASMTRPIRMSPVFFAVLMGKSALSVALGPCTYQINN